MKQTILVWLAAALVLLAGCSASALGEAEIDLQKEPAAQEQAGQLGLEPGAQWESSPQKEYRAVWVSYLEWQQFDFSGAEAFRAGVSQMAQNCANLGINTVIAQVRPFGDALYPSKLFPWSHLCTGTQGQDPGFDPLAILVEVCHSQGLEVEAWINPYRVQSAQGVPQLGEGSLQQTHPELVRQTSQGLYLDPASAQAQELIAQGVEEVLAAYPVDGIHFDDYFYPTTETEFDSQQYTESGTQLSLEDWRRQNVNNLVQLVYQRIKAQWPQVRLGISPQGNIDNNYNTQYSDVALWMAQPGYVDYILPQIYWGFDYQTQTGDTQFGFEQMLERWAGMRRCDEVALYVGLGAYRVGEGDGGSNPTALTQWRTGTNLAQMVEHLRQAGLDGYGLYRYDSLFANTLWPDLTAQEQQALAKVNQQAG